MFKEYGFIWKVHFYFHQGFWPQEKHIAMLQWLDLMGKK